MNTFVEKQSHTYKPVTRDFLSFRASKGARKALFLPSVQVGDVETCLSRGIVSTDTDFVFIERDKGIIPAISNRSKELGLKSVQIHANNVDDFDFTASHEAKPFDVVYIDLCGEMNGNIFQWIFQHREALNEVKTLAFTFECKPRCNKLFRDTFDSDFLYQRITTIRGKSGIIGTDIEARENKVAFWSVTMAAIALGRYTFDRIGNSYNGFSVNDCYAYKEWGRSVGMVYCTFEAIKNTGRWDARTEEVADTYGKKTGSKKSSVRGKVTPIKGGTRFVDLFYGHERFEVERYINGWTPRSKEIPLYSKLGPGKRAILTRLLNSL